MKPLIEKIYIDMDGVLVDQESYLASFAGLSLQDYLTKVEMLRALPGGEKEAFVKDLIVRSIAEEGFIKAPPMPYLDVFKAIVRIRLDADIPVEILSSSMENPDTYEEICRQKTQWLKNNGLGHLPTIFVQGGKLKQNYAYPNHVLIDDYYKNIDQWNAKGGIGILHRDIKTTYEQLVDLWD